MRYALINNETSVVDNVIELDDLDAWPLPDGFSLMQSDFASPGWLLVDGELVAPPDPE